MNSTHPAAAQAPSIDVSTVFPQLLRETLAGRSALEATNIVLALFDAGAASAEDAERWLTAIERIHQNS